MLLGGVHVPAEVLTAWEEGKLVIFTGAGISMSAPSNLPNFAGLAEQVGLLVQSELDPTSGAWNTQLDTFMDVLDGRDGVDVHELVKGIVTTDDSLPNYNHDAIARIAARHRTRVVTTNYDLHLETTLQSRQQGLEVFRAPALPLGDSFDGLVYLHGSAECDSRRLVVTDRDFSRAYFHSAWAARFLERMFSEYVVLFIGYSHSDTVMKYLSLGLGPRSKRYAITDDPNNATWERLRIATLDYPHEQHQFLTACLTEWAKHGERGLLEHRQRIRDLVSTPSEATPEELSYLEESIGREDRVGFFCKYAKHTFWLKWAAQKEPFKKLFDPTAQADSVTVTLAEWFAYDFALIDDTETHEPDAEDRPTTTAWSVFAEAGGVLSTSTWNSIGRALPTTTEKHPPHAMRWLSILLDQEHAGCDPHHLDYALEWVDLETNQDVLCAVLAHLMTPHLVPESGWGTARMAPRTRGDLHWLDEAWNTKFKSQLSDLAPKVLPVAEAALLRHLDLEAHVGLRGYSRRRSAIQPHVQDQYRDPIDAVIDAVRDTATALWDTDPAHARTLISRWLTSSHTLMRRLAVHLAGTDPLATNDGRIQFVLDHDLVDADGVSQEVLHLVGTVAPDISPDLIDQLVEAWEPKSDAERDLYRAFSRLEWLERNSVINESLNNVLGYLRDKLPDGIEGSPYPGMSRWMESGTDNGVQPLTVEEFGKRIAADPAGAVDYVLSFEERTFPRSGETSRSDAISMLRSTVKERPAAGLQLWPHLTDHPEIQGTVIAAWGHTTGADDAEAIMKALVATDLRPHLHNITQFFMYADRAGAAPWETVRNTDQFIQNVWEACKTSAVYESGASQDWIGKTFNTSAGLVVEFWFEMFRRRWVAAGDNWAGMPSGDEAFLTQIIHDPTERGALALTQVAGRLHLVDAANPTWTRTQLLPLRNWDDPITAEPFWWGVLTQARWNSDLVNNGLLDGLIETIPYLHNFRDDQARRWADLLASIALRCEKPTAETWVNELTARSDAHARESWLSAVKDEFRDLDIVGRLAAWDTWLAAYWSQRSRRIPFVLSKGEGDTLATLAPLLPREEFGQAVSIVEATTAGLDSHAHVVNDIPDELIITNSEEVGRYLTHLMNNTDNKPGRFWGGHYLGPKLALLVNQPGDWREVREAALRLGFDI